MKMAIVFITQVRLCTFDALHLLIWLLIGLNLGDEEFDPDIGSGHWVGSGQYEDISEEDQHRWTCCNETGSAEGCKTGRHKELNGEGPENESSEEDDEEESGEEPDED